jgi:hypothetical protein
MAKAVLLEKVAAPTKMSSNQREQLLNNIRGQKALIPDLKAIFADWKGIQHRHVSPWLEPLREKVNTKIQR